MARIDIHRPHQLPRADARVIVEKVAERMHEKFGTASEWAGDTLRFSRPGVNGSIAVADEAVSVVIDLGLMLSPMKGMIEQEIRRKLDEHFA